MHPPSLVSIFLIFLRLGLTSFGGPIAHLGYFREELIRRRQWLSEEAYADLIALCQFLPGPASSQVGFALGLIRGGFPGALAAWLGFTLPSALLLIAFSAGLGVFDPSLVSALVHGLKLVAVAVVAQALWGMAQRLCPDRERAAIALGALLMLALLPTAAGQIIVIVLGGLAGHTLCRNLAIPDSGGLSLPLSGRWARRCFGLFFLLLAGLPLLSFFYPGSLLALFEAFYRAGALVFGGGHVVLPLLESSTVASGWVDQDTFLAGYGAAQAIPGPLFTFSAYLGSQIAPGWGAWIALVAIFLPGMLLLIGTLPLWSWLRERPRARAIMAGTNAAVVGILASALFDPVWQSAVASPMDFALVGLGFAALTLWQANPWKVVLLIGTLGTLTAL